MQSNARDLALLGLSLILFLAGAATWWFLDAGPQLAQLQAMREQLGEAAWRQVMIQASVLIGGFIALFAWIVLRKA